MKSALIILLLLTFLAVDSRAQLTAPRTPIEVGLALGTSAYGGDLRSNDVIFLDQPGLSLGLGLRYPLSDTWAVSANALFARLRADDANDTPARQSRDYAFTSNLYEFSIRGEWYPFADKAKEEALTDYPVWSPYAFGGLGLAVFSSSPDFRGDTESLGLSEDLSQNENSTLVIPFGLGVRVELNKTTALGFEYGYRVSRSDYLDGISQSANPDRNDRYAIASLQIWKRFGAE